LAQRSTIEWTDATWNPVTGCTRVSPGCKHCYAARMAKRLQAMGVRQYHNGFQVTTHQEILDAPLRWRKPRTVFVNSMSDLFHEAIPLEFVQRTFDVMQRASWHLFQVLTKRPEVAVARAGAPPWPPNVWIGTSVENADYLERIRILRAVPARLRFLSLEPLLGPISELPLADVDWVIGGGESGPRARPMNEEWVKEIRDQCVAAGVPFFFKQWGGVNKKRTGRILDGRTWGQVPSPPTDHAHVTASAT